WLQVAYYGANPAAVVIGLDVFRIEPDRVVEILDGEPVGALAGIDLAATVERGPVVRILRNPRAQALDGRIILKRRLARRRRLQVKAGPLRWRRRREFHLGHGSRRGRWRRWRRRWWRRRRCRRLRGGRCRLRQWNRRRIADLRLRRLCCRLCARNERKILSQ